MGIMSGKKLIWYHKTNIDYHETFSHVVHAPTLRLSYWSSKSIHFSAFYSIYYKRFSPYISIASLISAKYISDVLHKFHSHTCKPVRVPIASCTSISFMDDELLSYPSEYRSYKKFDYNGSIYRLCCECRMSIYACSPPLICIM
uniref:Uncharacterized protein n=1 Tax=Solanum lycopersicum TaxID=4081 RepID=A0A3Q7IWC2_SOLLC